MRTTKSLFLTLTLGLFITFGFSQGVISGSAHDFSDGLDADGSGGGDSWISVVADQGDQICKFCHAPHNNRNAADNLLWNRAYSTTSTYTAYWSPTMEAASPGAQPGAESKMCLSCHDGVMALDAYGSSNLGTASNSMTEYDSTYDFGIDLSNDHPIGVTYDVGDTGLKAVNTAVTGVGTNSGITDITSLLGGVGQTTVECSSCHDVHNNGPSGVTSLLIKDNAASALCLSCHAK